MNTTEEAPVEVKRGSYPETKNVDDIVLPMTFCYGDCRPKRVRMQLTHPLTITADGRRTNQEAVAVVGFTPYLIVTEESVAANLIGKDIARAIMDHPYFIRKPQRIRDVTHGDDTSPNYAANQEKIRLAALEELRQAEIVEKDAELESLTAENKALHEKSRASEKRAEMAKEKLKEIQAVTYVCPFDGCGRSWGGDIKPGPRKSSYINHMKACKHAPKSQEERKRLIDEARADDMPTDMTSGDPEKR